MYKLTTFSSIIRIADGACIPSDISNSDYAAYLQWLNGWTETIRAPGTWTPEVPAALDDDGNELTALIPGYWTEGAVIETIVHPPHTPEPYVPPPVDDATRIASLWQAAHDYETAQVSGSAIGLLAIGVMQSKPKCLAVQGWIKSIWTVYYERKASGSTDYSFTFAGECPHTVPELMAELGL